MEAKNQQMRIAVAGVGFLGAQRAAAAKMTKQTSLAGVCDRDQNKARETAQRLGVKVFGSFTEILKSSLVDAVVVATPHADHYDLVSKAIRAHKHVLCEKPLAIDAADARTLAMLADEHKVKLATGFNHRFYPPVRDALALLSGWAIGRVENVRVEIGHTATLGFLEGWHADLDQSGGGTLMDNGPHGCDLIRRFMGEVVAAKAYVQDVIGLGSGCESEAFVLFRNHDRAIAELRSSWTLPKGYLSIDIRGSQGYLQIETAPWRLKGKLADGTTIDYRYVGERFQEKLTCAFRGCERSLIQELDAFTDMSTAHPRPEASGWDGCRATEMVQAAYESARSGLEVELQPPLVRVPGMKRATVAQGDRRKEKERA